MNVGHECNGEIRPITLLCDATGCIAGLAAQTLGTIGRWIQIRRKLRAYA
jgi:hypothetical protein